MKNNYNLIEKNLKLIVFGLINQPGVAVHFPDCGMSYSDQMDQMMEWIDDAGECSLAYENIVCLLDKYPFNLSGKLAVKLLEVGLILGFKTELEIDKEFDIRCK
ncbi:hypothetical protein [Xanthomonas sp. SS]|uniref:hypothetical protein n=1 Tax=Xanthomonas sp. SS TaxID=2724122 RepID=UPI0016398A9A|nr:hypothetical protein [Xanthomonas sp. SS]